MPLEIFRFEDFELDRPACELRRAGQVVRLQRIPLELLFLLIERRGEVVTRQQILERVWGKGVHLDAENSINIAVRKLRLALQDPADTARFVVTVPARGYRFVARIEARKSVALDPSRMQTAHICSLVGREREVAELQICLQDATSGHGRLLLISGESGIGKTRLWKEVANLAEAKGMAVLVGHCSDHEEAVPYLPLVEILESCVDRAGDRLRGLLGEEGPELARLLPKLTRLGVGFPPLLELTPQQARRHLFNCFCDFVSRLARDQPILLILEDLHWAEDSTLAMFDHLAHRLSDLPILVVGTYRDAELDVTQRLKRTLEDLLRGRLATPIRLKGLPRNQVAEMLTRLSGKTPPATVVREIYDETEGNPFFVEELFLHLKEENRLYDKSGQFRSDLKIGELKAPESIRLVVGRQLARLGDLTQRVFAFAAVIGRSFRLDVLEASTGADPNSLLQCIEEAEKGGLIFSNLENLKAQFEFSHELIRQAVLSGLSAGRRQRLHLKVAVAMERLYADMLDDHVGELAHHYRLGGDAAKAIHYIVGAAQQSIARLAHEEAVSLATTGLKLLEAIPNDEHRDRHELALQLTLARGVSINLSYAAPEAERAFSRALELNGRDEDSSVATIGLLGLHMCYALRADYDRAAPLQSQLLEIARATADSSLAARIHYGVGYARFWRGDFKPASEQFELAIRLSVEQPFIAGAVGLPACARAMMGLAMWHLGHADQALKLIARADSDARALQHPFVEMIVADFSAVLHMLRKDAPGTKILVETIAKIATEHGFVFELASANVAKGWADAFDGDSRGIDLLRESLSALWATGYVASRSWEIALVAELCLKFGRLDETIAALDDAIAFVARTSQGVAESEICRLKGEVELRLGRSHFGSASKWFERAIDAARKRTAKIAELRATVSLARLLAKQGKRDEARTMLAEIYNWFTEGLDTVDLKDAKALLDELAH